MILSSGSRLNRVDAEKPKPLHGAGTYPPLFSLVKCVLGERPPRRPGCGVSPKRTLARSILFFLGALFLRLCHLLRETGGVFLVLDVIDGESSLHVIRVFECPLLVRVVIGQLDGPALLVFVMNRIG